MLTFDLALSVAVACAFVIWRTPRPDAELPLDGVDLRRWRLLMAEMSAAEEERAVAALAADAAAGRVHVLYVGLVGRFARRLAVSFDDGRQLVLRCYDLNTASQLVRRWHSGRILGVSVRWAPAVGWEVLATGGEDRAVCAGWHARVAMAA